MENYDLSVKLLGLNDQNLPVFKDIRMQRLASIDKIKTMFNIMPRLMPKLPKNVFILNKNDPEWDDKMIYPKVNYNLTFWQLSIWGLTTVFYCYNWNVLNANRRLRHLRNLYPFLSGLMLFHTFKTYSEQIQKVILFEDYCETRAKELFEENKYMLNHEHFKRYVYFYEDMKETMARVHRQANNHNASDFKDSEIIIQDFIRRYTDPSNPEKSMFTEEGTLKVYN